MDYLFDSKEKNYAKFGLSLQNYICSCFSIVPKSAEAANQFSAAYDQRFFKTAKQITERLFFEIGKKPVACYSFVKTNNGSKSSFNFVLEDNSTLSIRTNYKGDKVSPREVGQAGFEKLNYYFSDIYGKRIETQEDIKHLFFYKIDEILPIFFDHLFDADYVAWVFPKNKSFDFRLMKGDMGVDIDYERNNFSFSRNLDLWNESTTLKYKGVSIAEIQVHKNRTFKFRFIMTNIIPLLIERTINNETLGITAEKTVCDLYGLVYPMSFLKRYSEEVEEELKPVIEVAFKYLPDPVRHSGSDKGKRGGFSKSSYDFVLLDNKELSLKTNVGKMVCPPEVGQPGAETCSMYFGHLIDNKDDRTITRDSYKKMVFEHVSEMLEIFIKHMFDCDYLLWVFKKKDAFNYRILNRDYASKMIWERKKFSFTRPTVDDWNESNTLKYDGISIGEFQVHNNRDCFKFRFNFENFTKIIERK